MSKPITTRLMALAANDECLTAVDMARVYHYRQRLRSGKPVDPIVVLPRSKQGFYFIEDGHHRAMAFMMEKRGRVPITIYRRAYQSPLLSWRWPRVTPLSMTRDLMKYTGMI